VYEAMTTAAVALTTVRISHPTELFRIVAI
jgi:hypothetical protein